jgi:hypothetical protein
MADLIDDLTSENLSFLINSLDRYNFKTPEGISLENCIEYLRIKRVLKEMIEILSEVE